MLQTGEDPAWIVQMMGHTTAKMLFERYGRFIDAQGKTAWPAWRQAEGHVKTVHRTQKGLHLSV